MTNFNAKNTMRRINTFIGNLDKIESNAFELSKESLGVLLTHGNVTPLAHLINELNSKNRSIRAKRAVKIIRVLMSSVTCIATTTKKFKDSGLSLQYKLINKPDDAQAVIDSLPSFDDILSGILLEEERKKEERQAAKAAETETTVSDETETETETTVSDETETTVTFASRAADLIGQLECLIFNGKDNLKTLSMADRNALERLSSALNAYKAFNTEVKQPLKKAA